MNFGINLNSKIKKIEFLNLRIMEKIILLFIVVQLIRIMDKKFIFYLQNSSLCIVDYFQYVNPRLN